MKPSKVSPGLTKAYLLRKGWKRTKTGNPWEWSLAPCPGRYTLDDAVAVQESMDKEKRKK